jgi:hypothetical protein
VSTQATLEPAQEPTHKRRWARLLGVLTGVVLVIAGVSIGSVVSRGSGHGSGAEDSKIPVAWKRPLVSADGLVDRSGVKIVHVAVTGGGGLVDLRFQVIDPNRAEALHDSSTPPAVVDQRSGLVVHELLMSHSHTGQFKAGVTYYLVFNNPGNWVHRGDRVAVLLGNARVENVTVR